MTAPLSRIEDCIMRLGLVGPLSVAEAADDEYRVLLERLGRLEVLEGALAAARVVAVREGAVGVLAIVDAASRAGTAERQERVTHGRHCICSACAREDWASIVAPCGMHGPGCPGVYAPLGAPGDMVKRGSAEPPAKPEEACECDYDRDDEGEWTGDRLPDRCPVHGPAGPPVKEGDDRADVRDTSTAADSSAVGGGDS